MPRELSKALVLHNVSSIGAGSSSNILRSNNNSINSNSNSNINIGNNNNNNNMLVLVTNTIHATVIFPGIL